MRLSLSTVFLTFVLIGAQVLAAPDRKLPRSRPNAASQNEFDEDPGPVKRESTSPTYPSLLEPTNLQIERNQIEVAHRGPIDVNFHVGTLGGNMLTDDEQRTTQFLGVRYIDYSNFEKAWDYTVEVHTQGVLALSVGHRWQTDPDEHFNSYYRVAFENFIDSANGIAGLIHLRHMKAMAAFGLGDIFELQRRVTGEVGVGYGLSGFVSYLQIGYNFNF